MPSPPNPGWVRIDSIAPPLSVLARLGQNAPTIDSGFGGWNEVTRPWRPPITTFAAPPALHLTLPIMLDGFSTGTSVERSIAHLQAMGQPTASDGATPRIRISTRGSAVPFTDRTWLLNDIQWGSEAIMDDNGNRVRQDLSLVLIEYVEDVYITQLSAAQRVRSTAAAAKTKAGAPHKRVVSKTPRAVFAGTVARRPPTSALAGGSGEDLLSVAARELGDANRWTEITALNGIRDPRYIRLGQVIRLP